MKTLYTSAHSNFKLKHLKLFSGILFYLFLSFTSNIACAQWTKKASELRKRAEANNVLYQNKLYMFGGFYDNPIIEKTNEVYDIAANKWSNIASFPAGKEVTHQGVVLVDDKVWLIGGRLIDAHGPAASQVIIYNITTNTWSDGPELINPATGKSFPMGAGGYALIGRTIHVFGGFGPTLCEDQATLHLTIDVDKYMANPNSVTWENKLAPLPIPRNHISYVVLGGKIYALGGQFKHDCGASDQVYCHVYDPVTDVWTRLTDLPIVRSHAEASTFAVDGKIFLAAGQGVGNVTQNTVYQFTPQSNNGKGAWTNLTSYKLPGSFLGLSAKIAGNSFIISNGALDKYSNERTETYAATVSRSTARTLGFSKACISQSGEANKTFVLNNLLYCIEDATPYVLTTNAPWLSVTKNLAGVATLSGIETEATVNTTGLAAANYTGKITATSTATGSSTSFCVNLTVTSSSVYNLTITSVGSGSITKSPDQTTYNANSVVTINALPATGWKFNGWSGDASTTANPLQVTMTKSKAITATFIQDSPPQSLVTNIISSTGRLYQLATLMTNTSFYSDRTYPINSVPASLLNVPFIKTPNDDKKNTTTAVFSFNLTQPATVYIAYDPRVKVLPAWLQSWTKLSDRIGMDDPKITYFELYSKDFPVGKVTLGGNMASPEVGAEGNYYVIMKAKPATIAASRTAAEDVDPDNILAAANPEKIKIKSNFEAKGTNKPILFPNPAHDIFRITFPENYKGLDEIRIVDMNGNMHKIAKSHIKSSGNTAEVHITPLSLKPGLYSVAIRSVDGKTDVIRIITGAKID